jgi:hypothetical protein
LKAEVFVQAANFYSSSNVIIVDYMQSTLMTDKSFTKDSSLLFDNSLGITNRVDIIKHDIQERARERGTVLNQVSFVLMRLLLSHKTKTLNHYSIASMNTTSSLHT